MTISESPRTLIVQLSELLSSLNIPASAAERRQGAVLLADFLHCLRLGESKAIDEAQPVLAQWCQPPPEIAAAAADRCHVVDIDDVHWGTLVHPASVVWSTVLGLGAASQASGAALMRAALVGYEGVVRLAYAVGSRHRQRFHSTATAGTVGAAAAASSLLDLSHVGLADALGHAVSVMGGSAGCLVERSDTRRFHRAHAVRSGIAAAVAAAGGLGGTRSDFERGGGAVGDLDAPARSTLLAEERRALLTTSVRLFSTSGWNQAAYEAAREASRDVSGAIHRVVVQAPPAVVAASAGGGAVADERWVSLAWAAAYAVVDGRGEQGGRVESLVPRVHLEADSERLQGAAVEVTSNTGKTARHVVEVPLGHPERPPAPADLAAKWSRDVPSVDRLLSVVEEELASSRPAAVSRLAPWWPGSGEIVAEEAW